MADKQKNIFQILAEIEAKVISVQKTTKAHNHKYAKIDAVIDELHPWLSELGCAITNTVIFKDGYFWLETTLHYFDQNISTSCPLVDWGKTVPGKSPMQNMGGSISYARRYNLLDLFNMYQTDLDKDAEDEKEPEPPKKENLPKKQAATAVPPTDLERFNKMENCKEYQITIYPTKAKVGELSGDQLQKIIDDTADKIKSLKKDKKDIPLDLLFTNIACDKYMGYLISKHGAN